MTYEQFKTQIIKIAEEAIENVEQVTVTKTLKNNGVELDGLNIRTEKCNITPTIYLNNYYKEYQDGREFDEVAQSILETYRLNKKEASIDTSFFMEFSSEIKENIIYKVINKGMNEELLSRVPYVEYLDLAIVFYYYIPEMKLVEGRGGIMITNDHLRIWNVSVDRLMQLAMENTPRLLGLKVKGIFSTIADYLDDEELSNLAEMEDAMTPLFVATNNNASNGAAVILYKDMLKSLSERFKSSLYIIPSSVHEVIVAKVMEGCEMAPEDLKEMIKHVNSTELSREDVLSDNLYYFNRKDNCLAVV